MLVGGAWSVHKRYDTGELIFKSEPFVSLFDQHNCVWSFVCSTSWIKHFSILTENLFPFDILYCYALDYMFGCHRSLFCVVDYVFIPSSLLSPAMFLYRLHCLLCVVDDVFKRFSSILPDLYAITCENPSKSMKLLDFPMEIHPNLWILVLMCMSSSHAEILWNPWKFYISRWNLLHPNIIWNHWNYFTIMNSRPDLYAITGNLIQIQTSFEITKLQDFSMEIHPKLWILVLICMLLHAEIPRNPWKS